MLIVEDELVFREGLRVLLPPFADKVEVIGEVSNTSDAELMLAERSPELVLLDLRLPKSSVNRYQSDVQFGLDLIKHIRRESPETRILVLSSQDEPVILFEALSEGAHGYLVKYESYDGSELVAVMQRIMQGEAVYGPAVAPLIRRFLQQHVHQQIEQGVPGGHSKQEMSRNLQLIHEARYQHRAKLDAFIRHQVNST